MWATSPIADWFWDVTSFEFICMTRLFNVQLIYKNLIASSAGRWILGYKRATYSFRQNQGFCLLKNFQMTPIWPKINLKPMTTMGMSIKLSNWPRHLQNQEAEANHQMKQIKIYDFWWPLSCSNSGKWSKFEELCGNWFIVCYNLFNIWRHIGI